MGEATKGITKAMGQMNRRTTDEFAFCTEDNARVWKAEWQDELVSEVMGDAIDDALEGGQEEEETEELVNQFLDEIGIDINSEVIYQSCYQKRVNYILTNLLFPQVEKK